MKLVQSFLFLFRAQSTPLSIIFPFLNQKRLFLSNSNFISIFARCLNAEYTLPKFLPNDKNVYTNIQYNDLRPSHSLQEGKKKFPVEAMKMFCECIALGAHIDGKQHGIRAQQ